MSNLPALADMDTGLAERSADPGEYVIACCERAKAWLGELLTDGTIEQIVEMKSQAEAIRVYTVQKNLGLDAQLAAAEIVRRAERGIGLAIRRGQEEGTIAKPGDIGGKIGSSSSRGEHLIRTRSFFPNGDQEMSDTYAVSDGVSDEQFDEAIADAKSEGNLSRANVVRKVKGEAPPEPRSEFHRKRRHIDHYRVIGETVSALEGLAIGLRLIDLSAIPEGERVEWSDQLRDALRPLNRFAKEVSQ